MPHIISLGVLTLGVRAPNVWCYSACGTGSLDSMGKVCPIQLIRYAQEKGSSSTGQSDFLVVLFAVVVRFFF